MSDNDELENIFEGTIKDIVEKLEKISNISETEETKNLSTTLGLTIYVNEYVECLNLDPVEARAKRKELMAKHTNSSEDEMFEEMDKLDTKVKRIINFK